MKSNFVQFSTILVILSLILSSCLNSTTTPTTSNDASFVSMTLSSNDSVKKGIFTLDLDGITIVNVDSLPYKTRIDSVYPTFSFKSASKSFLYLTINGGYKFTKGKKDSVSITGKDTVDFNQPLLKVSNFASDGITFRKYSIKVNVHKVEPELYNWNKLANNLLSTNPISQKSIYFNDKIYYYQSDGISLLLKTSVDGKAWNTEIVSGLTANQKLENMTSANGNLYLLANGNSILSSSDGINWGSTICSPAGTNYKSLLFSINDSLRSVCQLANLKYYFASSKDGINWKLIKEIPIDFPISDFAAIRFQSVTGKDKGLIISGISTTGSALSNRWSTEDGIYWVNFRVENVSLDTLSVGASVFSYDSKLFVLGTRTDNGKNYFKTSLNGGLSWQYTNKYNVLPADLTAKNFRSVLVYKPKTYDKINSSSLKDEIEKSNRIFVLGGISSTSDVWTAKLNRLNFLRQ